MTRHNKASFSIALLLCFLFTACSFVQNSNTQYADAPDADGSWTCVSKKVSGWEKYSFRLGTFLAVNDRAYYLGEGKETVVLAEVPAQECEVNVLFQDKGLTNFCLGKDEKEIVCYVQGENDADILCLDSTGKQIQRFSVDKEISEGDALRCMCLEPDGNLALVYGNKLVIMNPEGELCREIFIEDGTVWNITSEEKGHFLLKISETESGNGWIKDVSIESGVLTKTAVWDSTSDSAPEYPFSWNELELSEMDALGVGEGSEIYYVWTSNWLLNEDSPLYVNIVSRAEDVLEEQVPQTEITVVTRGTDQCLDALAIAYNKENENVKVNIEHLPIEEDAWNTRLASREKIDMVLLGADFGVLQKAGYLQEIDTYFDKLGQNREDIIPAFLSSWQVNSKTYGIPCDVSLCVPYLRLNEDISEEHSTEKILDLFRNHPEIKSENGLFSLELLRLCLQGDLDAYFENDGEKEILNADKLAKLCEEIRSLSLDKQAYYDELEELMQSGAPMYGELWVSNPKGIVDFYDKMGNAVKLIGYPTEEGRYTTIVYSNALCLMKQCQNLEESLDFMKYYYENHDAYYPYEHWGISYQEIQNQVDEACNGDQPMDAIQNSLTKDQEEAIWKIIEGAKSKNPYFSQIYAMLDEELTPCFREDRAFDDAIRVLSSRIGIFLAE